MHVRYTFFALLFVFGVTLMGQCIYFSSATLQKKAYRGCIIAILENSIGTSHIME